MQEPVYFDDEMKAQWQYAFEQAKADRPRYLEWLQGEIRAVIALINKFDKLYILGGLGAKLLKSSPNFYNQFLETYEGPDEERAEDEEMVKDEQIEVLLEYAMSLASASPNTNAGVIPSAEEIDGIYEKLGAIKFNLGFYEMSAENPKGGNEADLWLKLRVMEDALNVRGNGYYSHVTEVYNDTFAPHDGFFERYYGINSSDILEAIKGVDILVGSKVGDAFGGMVCHKRLLAWSESVGEGAISLNFERTGRTFMQQFLFDNPDLADSENPDSPTLLPLDYVGGYKRLFWVVPKTPKEEKVFKLLSHQFGENSRFNAGAYGGFPLGDSVVQRKPLILIDGRFYCFSVNLPFRNLFNITSSLLEEADPVYYENRFKGNSSPGSRDNYIELKTKKLFEKLLPSTQFYHSLKYNILEDGKMKEPELDILGVGPSTLYIIEVKAGELNKKHRRGAIKGLKDRIEETISEGSYQCYRAEKYIQDSESPEFRYSADNQGKVLKIDKTSGYQIVRISVMYEHFATVAVNLKYLIESGILSEEYKWSWIVSLWDLMIFAELLENEADFQEYLTQRFSLYERGDIEFTDEIDILGLFLQNGFPLGPESPDSKILMFGHKQEIDNYFNKRDLGFPDQKKPKIKK
jgi:hypothetical protein